MNSSRLKVVNNLTVKIAIPITITILALGFLLYQLVFSTVQDFADQNIKRDLENISRNVYDMIDKSYQELLQKGEGQDKISLIIQQGRTIGSIENFLRHEDIMARISKNDPEKGTTKVLFKSPGLKDSSALITQAVMQENRIGQIEIAGAQFYTRYFQYGTWNWHIIIFKDTIEYSDLIKKVKETYQLTGLILLGVAIMLLYYLRRAIKIPISKIITPIEKGEFPLFRGTYEFEYLSDSIRDMMNTIKENEIEQRKKAEELRKANKAAQLAAQAKSDFLANMSHEIRTPMNGVIATCELALGETNLSPTLKKYLDMIHSSGYSLLRVINDILDFTKIEEKKLVIESEGFDLITVLDQTRNMFSTTAIEKKIEFLIDVDHGMPNLLVGDALRLQQILTNLIGNAIKFTDEHGFVLLKISCDGEDSAIPVFKFSVKDNGIGMSVKHLENLFDPFVQEDASTTRKYGGTGLGLSITKHLVDLMKGQIWVETSLNKGSTFHFALPFELQSRSSETRLSIPEDLKNISIIVIDENPMSRDIIVKILTGHNFSVASAASGKEAEQMIKMNQGTGISYEAVIIDGKMLEDAQQLFNDRKIIVMTGLGMFEDELASKDISIHGIITKPLHPVILINTILEVFGKTVETHSSMNTDLNMSNTDFMGAKILVVEDNPANQEIATAVLLGSGCKVETADNGAAALKKITEKEYDLILMDIQMPVMDGYETTQNIRVGDDCPDIPIVAMTAHALKGDKEKCIEAGMDDYATKPIQVNALFKTLSKYLAIKHKPVIYETAQNRAESLRPNSAATPEIPGIDFDLVMERLGISVQAFIKILKQFARSHQSHIEQLHSVFKSEDLNKLQQLAHTLKGSSANICAQDLYAACKELDQQCKHIQESENSGENFPDEILIQNIIKELSRIIEKIHCFEDYAEKPEVFIPVENIYGNEEIKSFIVELSKALDSCNAKKSQAIISQIMEIARLKELAHIERLVEDFDFDQASEKLVQFCELSEFELDFCLNFKQGV